MDVWGVTEVVLVGDNDHGQVADIVAGFIEKDRILKFCQCMGSIVDFQAFVYVDASLSCPLQGVAVNDAACDSGRAASSC